MSRPNLTGCIPGFVFVDLSCFRVIGAFALLLERAQDKHKLIRNETMLFFTVLWDLQGLLWLFQLSALQCLGDSREVWLHVWVLELVWNSKQAAFLDWPGLSVSLSCLKEVPFQETSRTEQRSSGFFVQITAKHSPSWWRRSQTWMWNNSRL